MTKLKRNIDVQGIYDNLDQIALRAFRSLTDGDVSGGFTGRQKTRALRRIGLVMMKSWTQLATLEYENDLLPDVCLQLERFLRVFYLYKIYTRVNELRSLFCSNRATEGARSPKSFSLDWHFRRAH